MSYLPGSEGVKAVLAGTPAPRLLDEVRRRLRLKHYSLRTEQAYIGWTRQFIMGNGKRHPRAMGATEVERFLSVLAVRAQVAASTLNQALSALLFLYREVLQQELPWMDDIRRAQRPERLPTVLSRDEVQALLAQMSGVTWLMAGLLYGAGLRLMTPTSFCAAESMDCRMRGNDAPVRVIRNVRESAAAVTGRRGFRRLRGCAFFGCQRGRDGC